MERGLKHILMATVTARTFKHANETPNVLLRKQRPCSDGNAAVEYYRELLRFQRMKPRRARKIAIMFAETLPSIMRSLDAELAVRMREMREVEHGE